MVANDSPDWLPSGWTVQFKVLKSGRKVGIYTNTETGKIVPSKDEVFQLINAGSSCSTQPQTSNTHVRLQAERTPSQPVNEKDQLPEWLPKGWKVEVRTRKSGTLAGKEYKSYIDPLNGSKFYSKLEVLRYLKTVRHKSRIARDVKSAKSRNCISKKKTSISTFSADKVVVQKCKAEDLPSGWIKETRIKQSSKGIRKDPFYKDPVSGYVFRSKRDALRYIETGEISRSAIRPKESGSNAPALVKDEIAPSSAAKRQKLQHPASRRQRFTGKTESQLSDSELSKTDSKILSAKRVSPEARVIYASGDETVQGKHPLNNVIQECVEPEEKCSPNNSTSQKREGSKRGRDKSLPLSDAGLSEKSREKKDLAENGTVSTPIHDARQDENFLETATEKSSIGDTRVSSRKSKVNKVVDGPEKSRGEKDLAKIDPVSTATLNTLHDKNFLKTATEKNSTGDNRVNSRKSKDKKVHDMPPRSSKRLAGNEPDLTVNLELGERALIAAIRKSRKTEATQNSVLTSDGLVDSPFVQREITSEIDLVDNNASTNTKNPLEEDPSNKSTVPPDDQVAQEEQHQKLETEKVDDNPAPQLSFLFGSDPCLEFAFKTLIGELPLDGTSVNGPILTREAGTLQHENLLESGMKNSSTGKSRFSKAKSKLNLPRRSSKRLAGVEPEPVASSVASERALQDVSINPYDKGTISGTNLLDKAKQPLRAGPKIELTNQLSTKADASVPEPSDKRKNSSEDLVAAPQEQPRMRETERAELKKPESTRRMYETENSGPQLHESRKEELGSPEPDTPFSIADYWSDPCLDFAFKTLTGVIPIEDTLAQGCFQEQVDVPDNCKNGNAALPDFGSCSLFETDISSQFDTLEKSSSSQQFAGTSASLPPQNLSFSSCNGIHSQQQPPLEANKDLHQKVKS